MRRENKIIYITRDTSLLFLRIAQQPVMIQVSKTRGRIRCMIDNIGNKKDRAQHHRDPVNRFMRPDLAILYKIKTRDQQDSRAGIQDSMKKWENMRVEPKIDLCRRHQDQKSHRRRYSDRNNNDRLCIAALTAGKPVPF